MNIEYIKNIKELRSFLNELIQPPYESFVLNALNKLYALDCVTSLKDNGKLTEIGKAIGKFRTLEPNISKILLLSYYNNCVDEIVIIMTLIQATDSRMESLFLDTSRDNRINTNKVEQKRKKDLYSQYGDFITLLQTYQKYKLAENKKEFIDTYQLKRKVLDFTDELIGKYKRNIFKVVQPAELRKKYYSSLLQKNNKNNSNKKMINEINKEMKNDIGGLEDLNVEPSSSKVKSGGGGRGFKLERKPYELKLFNSNSNSKLSEDDTTNNVFYCLFQGYFTNFAKSLQEDKYKTCFPIEKSKAKLSKYSSLLSYKSMPKLVIYNELFQISKTSSYLKLNMSGRIPLATLKTLSKNKLNLIADCFKKEKTVQKQSPKYKHKKQSPKYKHKKQSPKYKHKKQTPKYKHKKQSHKQ